MGGKHYPAITVPKKQYDAALKLSNMVRGALGRKPVKKLKPGIPGASCRCAIARTVDPTGKSVSVSGHTMTIILPKGGSIAIPKTLEDHGSYSVPQNGEEGDCWYRPATEEQKVRPANSDVGVGVKDFVSTFDDVGEAALYDRNTSRYKRGLDPIDMVGVRRG